MNKYRKLINNSAIFAIGDLGSKLILIFLVPLYTYYLSTSEYGTIDIITTTTSMLLPIISLSIYDAVLRFVMDKEYHNEVVFTNSLVVTLLGSLVALFFYPFLSYFNILDGLLGYMYIIFILQALQSIFTQFVRAIGEIKVYSYNGILMTIVTAGMSILLIVNLEMGMDGYFIAVIIGNIISIIHLFFQTKLYSYIKLDGLNRSITKEMLIYSIPLIPNALMWWIMNASNRYFILFFVGASANGLFAVANKIPSLLSILNTIFFKAWQLSAIEEYEDESKTKFYSQTFYYFSVVMFVGTSIILMLLKYMMGSLVSKEFYSSWEFIPFLLIGIVFSSFSAFLGTNYIAAKKTKGIFRTSLIGAAINIILNLIFIPLVGTNGAAISTMLSFLIIWIMRTYDTKKFINMKLDITHIVINLALIFTQVVILYMEFSLLVEFTIEIVLFIFVIIVNKKIFELIKQIRFKPNV
ncbi:lipopolysaccharide biosynthesis protein [Paenibacillus sp. NPDC057934]|uniref:lipopolysaccharide biosynthesis protein n=1 Tax=Paenibacillus sp. NPDC057934 TaxID=3346282 RepID=UPI0036DA275F